MKTYNKADVQLIFEWVDRYFEVNALIGNVLGSNDRLNPPPVPSFDRELEYQRLRLWFCKNHNRFVPIWADFCLLKGRPIDCIGNVDGMEYRENPFLYYYYPDNLLDLAYTIGITSGPDTWDPDKQNVELIININNQFSYIVRHLKYWIGEFVEIREESH